MAVVSSRSHGVLEQYLSGTGILKFFRSIICPEDAPRPKPHPDPALAALRILEAEAGESLFIGDAVFDMECGSRAGMDTAFVAWSPAGAGRLERPPTWVLTDMRDLLRVT
jgi:AHBA synthesis associated protein